MIVSYNAFETMIPKQIVQVAIGLNHNHHIVQDQIKKTKELNPNYKYTLITEESELDNFVQMNFPEEVVNAFMRLNILVAKIDFWRYLYLLKNGGIYFDIDSAVDRPLDELIQQHNQAIITAEGNPGLYAQWVLIFAPGHPILRQLVELIVDNIENNRYPNDIHKMTGPGVFARAINNVHSHLFGEPITHKNINFHTDTEYTIYDISYRIYSKDMGEFFRFQYPEYYVLYDNREHWRVSLEKGKPLLSES